MPLTFIISSMLENLPFSLRYSIILSAVFSPIPFNTVSSSAEAVLMLITPLNASVFVALVAFTTAFFVVAFAVFTVAFEAEPLTAVLSVLFVFACASSTII